MSVNVSYENCLRLTYTSICYWSYVFFIFFWITLNGKKENKIIIIIDDFYHNTDIFQTVFWIRVNGSVHTDSCAQHRGDMLWMFVWRWWRNTHKTRLRIKLWRMSHDDVSNFDLATFCSQVLNDQLQIDMSGVSV